MILNEWISIAESGPPEPEIYVLCWGGNNTFVDWFGSLRDAGRRITHWMPYKSPPDACFPESHDGYKAMGKE